MSRAFYVAMSLFSISCAAIGIAYLGIVVWMFYGTLRDDVAAHALVSLAASLIVPVFFLGFMIVAACVTLKWAVCRLFQRQTNLPDFF